ncbi:MAG TPA: penicillin-binding protein 1A [Pseudomonadales bacterium]|nr:penicillin-binding protein 1A [Pseudomonadales bacterium]
MIAEFGEIRREPLQYNQIPPLFIKAILAAEDARFFEHNGVDLKGLARAVVEVATTGHVRSGGSTITMQVAKNFFLENRRDFIYKLQQILLAFRIEQELTKEEILELYCNKIYLGHRAYGIATASQVYYGKPIDQLAVENLAMIAGLPKAPSAYNPITNPNRALTRRNWILSRMLELGFIDQTQYHAAVNVPLVEKLHGTEVEADAPYVAEMVRAEMVRRYGQEAMQNGYSVVTTLSSVRQAAATAALQNGLIDYDRSHGWRGVEKSLGAVTQEHAMDVLDEMSTVGNLTPVVVVSTTAQSTAAITHDGELITIPLTNMKWAGKYISPSNRGPAPKTPAELMKPGDVIRVFKNEKQQWELAQIPKAQAALVSLDPDDGAIQALVGGFDFELSKFNRVVQAGRQPGSNFKPFIYAAAIDSGMTPATIINDAPIVLDEGKPTEWRPGNAGNDFLGPIPLRKALYLSRNTVSVRVLQALGIQRALDYLQNFGFDPQLLPRNFSLALGAADVSPLQIARGYAVLANGGYKVDPYFIESITDRNGKEVWRETPAVVCDACEKKNSKPETDDEVAVTPVTDGAAVKYAPRTLDPRVAFIVSSMLQDVIRKGTGTKALALKRNDLAGKTGTTNEAKDAWFSGYNGALVTSVWVGFDNPEPLGKGEFGGVAALPIWMDYMHDALQGVPETMQKQPDGIVSVKINPFTGERASTSDPDAMFEYFMAEHAPAAAMEDLPPEEQQHMQDEAVEQLF